MDDRAHAFLEAQHAAAMVSLKRDGTPHVARVAIALVDGKVWSSGVPSRVRTRLLRRDPRCTLFVFESGGHRWLGAESTVTILDGPEAPEQNLRLFRVMQAGMEVPEGKIMWQGKPLDPDAFLRAMVDEQRLVYQFDITRSYGMH